MTEAAEALRELAHAEEIRAVNSRQRAQSHQAIANQEASTADTAEANAKAYRVAAAQLDMMPISTAVAEAMEGAKLSFEGVDHISDAVARKLANRMGPPNPPTPPGPRPFG